MKLFATDLDGTLLDHADAIHPRDLAAIATARKRGVLVTIATGRLTSRTHPIAQVLGLDLPLVCADGGVLACSATQRVLHRRPVHADVVLPMLDAFSLGSLASFVMTEAVIHSCERGEPYHAYMRGWASTITTHADVRTSGVWREDADAAIMLVGIGSADSVDAVAAALVPLSDRVDIGTFDSSRGRVLRVMAKGASKGAALAALARELGIQPEDVAVAGDWWNDLSMFEFAGRSFAMPHAPAEVRAAATHALDHDIAQHGRFADALEQWLDEVT